MYGSNPLLPRLMFAALVLGVLLGRPASLSAEPEGKPVKAGRFQTAQPDDDGGYALIDTTSGECWLCQNGGTGWIDLAFPVKDTGVSDGTTGRFSVQYSRRHDKDRGRNIYHFVICDTATGRCWNGLKLDEDKASWSNLGPPKRK